MPTTTMPSDIGDIVTFYLEDYDQRKNWVDIARDLTHYTCAQLFAERMVDGNAHEKQTFNLKAYSANNTVASDLFDDDSINIQDLGVKGTVYTHMQKTHFALDVREPSFMSRNATEILDYLQMRESDMYDGFFEQNETWLWSLPAGPNDGTNGKPKPLGIPYWLVQGTGAVGYNGGVPSGYSTVAGVSASLAGWKNINGSYAAMNDSDFGLTMTKAMDKARFKAPKPMGEETAALGFQLYSAEKPYYDYQSFLFNSNDNVGSDGGKFRGGAPSMDLGVQYFRKTPWTPVPALSEVGGPCRDLNEPIYGINWNWWNVRNYGGMFMQKDELIRHPTKSNVRVQWMNSGYQIVCRNRRANFVIRNTNASST